MPERNRFLRGMTVLDRLHARSRCRSCARSATRASPSTRCARCCGSASTRSRRSRDAPLQWATFLGFVFSMVAFLAIPLTVVARYANIFERGVPTTIIIVLLLGRHPADHARHHRRVHRAHLRRGQAPAAVRRGRTHQRGGADVVRIAVLGAGVAGLVAASAPDAGRPYGRRVRALARARRPGGDDRRRRRAPARALLPPPVHARTATSRACTTSWACRTSWSG